MSTSPITAIITVISELPCKMVNIPINIINKTPAQRNMSLKS